MGYLDAARLGAIDPVAFRSRRPYPWVNPQGLLTESGYRELKRDLPDLALFESRFGESRKYGQASHDRFALEWTPETPLAASWRDFIGELQGEVYARFLGRLLCAGAPRLRFHWHYTASGGSVSPHCDAKNKLGSHIFYFNDSDEWDPAWGGETLILDDGGRFHSDSNPDFEDFDRVEAAHSLDNHSLIFVREGASWHGVRPISAPAGRLRKVFIVVFERPALARRLARRLAAGAARAGERS